MFHMIFFKRFTVLGRTRFMKIKRYFGIPVFMAILAIVISIDTYNYRQSLNDISFVHYITGSGSGYSSVYLTAIVPIENYHEDKTIKTILRYVRQKNSEIPDTLRIVLYDSMEKLSDGNSYFEMTFRK